MASSTTSHDQLRRNVIIQRDPRGYGIRISGDNPVAIQSVNPGIYSLNCIIG